MNRPVKLRIERLVLEGVAPRDRGAFVGAFEAALARVLASGDLPLGGNPMTSLSVTTSAPADAASAGHAAAVAVARAIGGAAR
jgi:hypothetical protein